MSRWWLMSVMGILLLPMAADAFSATSTSFKTIQGIQSVFGSTTTNPFTTSASFMHWGAGGEAALGTSTSGTFFNSSGLIASVARSKNTSTSLTFTVDSNTKSFGTISPAILSANTSSLDVTTDNSSGFSVSVARSDADTTLDLTTDAAVNITDKTAWDSGATCGTAGNATASTTQPETLQFRVRQADTDSSNYCSSWWGSGDTTATALFAGFPIIDEPIAYRASAALTPSTSVVLYNLTVPLTQKTGDYTGAITFTVVANP